MGSSSRLSARKLLGVLLTVVGLYGVVDWIMTPKNKLPWSHDEAAAFAEAKEQGKGVMIDVSASWCAPCAELEANTFSDEVVHGRILDRYIPLKFDVSDGTDADEAIMNKYSAHTLPAVVFLTADGVELGRVDDYVPPDVFLKAMKSAEDSSAGEIKPRDRFGEALDKGWLWAYLLAFAFGFLTSLTPCVYPMIPITVAVFGARDDSVTRRKAFLLATSYVFGMGLLYSILGTSFALAGGRAGELLANPYVVTVITAILILFSASLFGAFEIALPSSLQARLSQVGGKGYGGAFGMGLVGGLVAAPCTGPFLAGMLGFVAATGNWVAGSTLLFTYAIGVGVLFWVIAMTSMSLPKSGRWMDSIKSVGGIALLVVALYFLRGAVEALRGLVEKPTFGYLAAAVGLVVIGLILGAVHRPFVVQRGE